MDRTDHQVLASRLVEALSRVHPARLYDGVQSVLGAVDGIDEVMVWLADMGYNRLSHITGAQTVDVVGSVPGRSFASRETIETEDAVFAPIDSVGRTVGVLELRGTGVHSMIDELPQLCTVIANRMIASRGHSDEIEMKRGAGALDIAATIQHELMPIPSYSDDKVDLGGQLEPAYEIAGDAFDYAINDGHSYFGVFDAVGHGLRSSLLTTVAVGTFRLQRRRRQPLGEVSQAIDAAVNGITGVGEFVTGVIGRVSEGGRILELSNAGHLPPQLIRDGKAHQLELEAVVPYGLDSFSPSISTTSLQPGDAVYVFSDGIIEAYDSGRTRFGLPALISILEQHERDQMPVRRVCRDVLRAVIDHVGGSLRDDATIFGIRILA